MVDSGAGIRPHIEGWQKLDNCRRINRRLPKFECSFSGGQSAAKYVPLTPIIYLFTFIPLEYGYIHSFVLRMIFMTNLCHVNYALRDQGER